jgi:hypothetical protein
MSNYKFVQWNDSTPLDHQRLYTMSENDQYLYDLASNSAKGLLYTDTLTSNKSLSGTSGSIFSTSGSFYVEENRVIKATFVICGIFSAVSDASWNRFRFFFSVSGSNPTQNIWIHQRDSGAATGVPSLTAELYDLDKGYHTINVTYNVSAAGTNTAYIEAGSSLFVEDLGQNTELPANKIY